MTTKPMSARFELIAQNPMVVNLTIEDHGETSAGGLHRLVPEHRQVDDRKAPESERNAADFVGPDSRIVRPAVDDCVGHTRRDLLHSRCIHSTSLKEAGDSAHYQGRSKGSVGPPKCNTNARQFTGAATNSHGAKCLSILVLWRAPQRPICCRRCPVLAPCCASATRASRFALGFG